MSILTSLTRAWLTRTLQPFVFRNENDQDLPYADCDALGLYVHIPFCKSVCNFCPYCKTLYGAERCERYVDSLLQEIRLVGSQTTERKRASSLYFGGGTPALASRRIREIVETLNEYFVITDGIGLELHPDNVNAETLGVLKESGVSRISIGIQSFGDKYQRLLGRKRIDAEGMKSALASVPFETVSMDFIFALPGQTYDDLKSDIETAFSLGANHVAIYPFIDFTFTSSRVEPLGKRAKRELLDAITRYCLSQGYSRRSIWTFSSDPGANYSSMTRDTFLGFGCSAASLFRDQFKINTFDVESYCSRISAGRLATSLTHRFSERQRMIYWLFWTAYGTRVDSRDFEQFFGVPLEKAYGFELWLAKRLGFATERDGVYEMTLKGAFYYHYYENFYTLSYIDKMWGVLRKEAFPESIEL